MNVLLVGNSRGLLAHKSGELIDSFDQIVRFNGGNPIAHPESLGTRTDYWSFSTQHRSEYEKWKIPGAVPMCLNGRITYPLGVPDAVYNDDKTYLKLTVNIGHPRPSTGLITAHYIAKKWECTLHCIGFDFFENGTWYRSGNLHGPHDGNKEREYMTSLGVNIL